MLIHTLALGFLLSPSPATDPQPVDDWLDLDTEIEALEATTSGPGAAIHIQGRLIGTYFHSRDPYLFTGSFDHASGVDLRSARLEFLGGNENWDWRISGDLESGSLEVIDAWASRQISSTTDVTVGRFKRPVLQSSMISSKYRMFWNRGNNGEQAKTRDYGAKLTGHYGQIHAFLSAMNNSDGIEGVGYTYFVSGRLEYDLIGEPFDKYEGAYGAAEGMHMGFAAVAGEDRGVPNGIFAGYEFELVSSGFYLGADMINYDSDYDTISGLPAGVDPDATLSANAILPAVETSLAGASPFTVTGSLLFGESRFEVAARLEVFDDLSDTSRTSLSFSVYDEVFGPNSRIMIDYSDVTSENQMLEGDKIEIGYIFVLSD